MALADKIGNLERGRTCAHALPSDFDLGVSEDKLHGTRTEALVQSGVHIAVDRITTKAPKVDTVSASV